MGKISAKFGVNNILVDRWYPEWGAAVVKEVTKTKYRLNFPSAPPNMKDDDGLVTYDYPHAHKFLEARKSLKLK